MVRGFPAATAPALRPRSTSAVAIRSAGPTPTAAGTVAARIPTSVAAPPAALAQGEGDRTAPTIAVGAAVATGAVVAVAGGHGRAGSAGAVTSRRQPAAFSVAASARAR